jgi:hypothetical protein
MFAGLALPELVLRDIAAQAVAGLVNDPLTLDYVMAARPAEERDSLRTALLHRPGKARLGYALEELEDWQVTVFMTGTQSGRYRTLGDVVDMREDELVVGVLASDITNVEGIVLPLVGGLPATPIPARGRVRIGGTELSVYHVASGQVWLDARGLQGTTASAWPVDTLCSFHELTEVVGWGETCRLRVDVLSSNAYLNLILAATIKAAMILSADAFNAQGLTLQDVDESDLTPRPALWPAHLFNRTLMVTVQRNFGLPDTLPIITRIDTEVVPVVDFTMPVSLDVSLDDGGFA